MQVGPEDHVICALSGGVDSTVAATLVNQVLGDRLHCVFVDNGLLRYKVESIHLLSTLFAQPHDIGTNSAKKDQVCCNMTLINASTQVLISCLQ